jgi:hypothetical protein
MNAYRNPKDCLGLTLYTLCAAGDATHLGAAGQHNVQAARGNRGEYTKPNQNMICVGNLSLAMGVRNQVGIWLPYRPVSLCSLATQFQTRFLESIPRPIAGLKLSSLSILQTIFRRLIIPLLKECKDQCLRIQGQEDPGF